jgi:hypothetical protein
MPVMTKEISATEALQILMAQMTAPAAAERLTDALHTYKCRIWRDGKLAGPAEVAHLSINSCDDADPDHWYAVVGDDRWNVIPAEYGLDAAEVRNLLPSEPRKRKTRSRKGLLSEDQVKTGKAYLEQKLDDPNEKTPHRWRVQKSAAETITVKVLKLPIGVAQTVEDQIVIPVFERRGLRKPKK